MRVSSPLPQVRERRGVPVYVSYHLVGGGAARVDLCLTLVLKGKTLISAPVC